MVVEEKVVDRVNQLIQEAQSLSLGTEQGRVRSQQQAEQCKGWLAAALNIVQIVVSDPIAGYRKTAEQIAAQEWGYVINKGVGEMSHVLVNMLADAQVGLLASVADVARAEVFDDFLDHAKSYLTAGHIDRAGVIAGVVFEDSLRRVCRKNKLDEKGEKLDALISELQKAGVISPTKAKRARVAAHVRTKATHAQWEEFDGKDVEATIQFSEELILNHIEG